MAELATQIPLASKRPACAAVAAGRRATLLDLLDRVLGKGVVAYGDIVLSIADIDLVYLNLRAVLSAIGTLEQESGHGFSPAPQDPMPPPFSGGAPEPWKAGLIEDKVDLPSSSSTVFEPAVEPTSAQDVFPFLEEAPNRSRGPAGRMELDPQKLEQGLAKLVLTLINLLRRLMERQAIRRMEAGTLTPEQLERRRQRFAERAEIFRAGRGRNCGGNKRIHLRAKTFQIRK